MFWAIGYVLKKYLRSREVVICGNGYNAMKWSAYISQYSQIDHIVRPDRFEELNPLRQYIVLCDDVNVNYSVELNELGFKEIEDYYNWTEYDRTNGHLPVDVKFYGTSIGCGSYFSFARNNLKNIKSIGRFCSIASTVIVQGNHSMNRITSSSLYPMLDSQSLKIKDNAPTDKDPHRTGRRTIIGNDVWIGANVFINSSKVIRIGNGAIIGAGSLLLNDVPPYAVVYGSPAKVVRFRFSKEQIAILEQVRWWDWSREQINENIELLMYPEKFFNKFSEIME